MLKRDCQNLTPGDLLRLILAYAPDNYSGPRHGNTNDEYRGKRNGEHSVKDSQKRQKLGVTTLLLLYTTSKYINYWNPKRNVHEIGIYNVDSVFVALKKCHNCLAI